MLMCYKRVYFASQKPHFCDAKIWFLQCKSMVFAMQKYGFCNAKTYLLFSIKFIFTKVAHSFRVKSRIFATSIFIALIWNRS